MKNPRLVDLTGQRFGELTVIRQDGNTKGGGAVWLCRCGCGKKTRPTGTDLRQGKVRSCGHNKMEAFRASTRTHGQTGTRVYRVWKSMRTRCANKNYPGFKDYGGRGITICKEWGSFESFYDWAKKSGYRDDLTIERKDVNGNYEPSNCTWIPRGAQSANRNYTLKNSNGELWWHIAQRHGITRAAYATRVHDGWTMELASTWPMFKKRPRATTLG